MSESRGRPAAVLAPLQYDQGRPDRGYPRQVVRPQRLSVGALVGILVAAILAVTGSALVFSRTPRWSATSALIVTPQAAGAGADSLASLYDTLSRGQVAATYAELFRNAQLQRAAEKRAGVPTSAQRDSSVTVTVVTDTSLIDVSATAGSAQNAVRVADAVAQQAQRQANAIGTPYAVNVATTAAGSASRQGHSRAELLSLTLLVAVISGLLVHQAWAGALRTRRWDRALSGDWPAVAPPPDDPAPSPRPAAKP